ncbi:aminotransferase class I/II-fold pyridoxal phosphate-dependent enzyme [Mangrovihabitans endophyticus]|uniref:GntR family transcriptional regulator n=1 Tax=Mangrovihabitans endophyticus TaxID=1751298 RepID=A0A8J3C061_9ACTN|nr:aminotransferase class I/II-fold pyridoxal phosphate-dependent enzyme [Mangrovihabitans endophyticus]GGK90739.1 GntR family transcriptional regulator [Mangrovihabitans endophyticus]
MAEQYQVTGSTAAEISASIERGVRQGDYAWGAALPPVRLMAGRLHVSPATVAKAYQELRRRGVVETGGRRGTRVRARPAVASTRSALRPPVPDGILDLSSGEPDACLLPRLASPLRAVAAASDSRDGHGVAGYAAAGLSVLAEAARRRLAADGVPVERADITVTSGTLDAIERLLTTHLRPGDAVAVEDPGWANLLDLVAALGLRAVPMAVDDEGPLPEALTRALADGVSAVVITVRAQNPVGAAVTAARAAALRECLAARPTVLLIEDDHAAELAGAPLHAIGPVTSGWAFSRSASKSYGPDLRVAVLAGDEATVARVTGRMRIGAGWVSTVLQGVLLALWRDASVTTALAAAGRSYDRRRSGLIDALRSRGLEARGETGMNVWVPVADETHAVAGLRDRGYAVAPGSLFRVGAPAGIRITVSPLDESGLMPLADAVAAVVRPADRAVPGR